MKKVTLLTIVVLISLLACSQDFNSLINQSSDTIAKKIITTGKKKVAITDFINIDQSITQLGTFLSEEISSQLSNLTDNQAKFRVLERANLDQVFKEKHLLNFSDGAALAKELGKIDAADMLIFATITDFDGYFRVVIKLLDTRNGDALSSYKVSFVKTPSLENLNKIVVRKSVIVSQPVQTLSNNSEQTTSNGATGDYCFKNVSGSGGYQSYDAKITVSKSGDDTPLKTIHARSTETSCMYELKAGIYKVSISWVNGDYEVKKEVKEIRVVSGKSGLMEINSI